jgi:hypothetical protein
MGFFSHTVFLMEDGTAKAVGNNSSGQLGLGNTNNPIIEISDIPISGIKSVVDNVISLIEVLMKYLFQDGEEIKTYGALSSILNPDNVIPKQSSHVFDHDKIVGYTAGRAPSVSSPIEYAIDFGEEKVIYKYTIITDTKDSDSPSDWTFQGWDGKEWKILDTQVGIKDWSYRMARTFDIPNTLAFSQYKVVITKTVGVTNWLQIMEIEMYEALQEVGWKQIGTAPSTKEMFDTHGMTDLSVIDNEAIQQLSDVFKLIALGEDASISSLSVDVTVIPKRELVSQQEDMILPTPIKSFTLSATAENSSVLKVIASNDSGSTWKTFDGEEWQTVNADDLGDIALNGMTSDTFNSVTEDVWKAFLPDLKVRFAYYLDLGAITDTLQLDNLSYETVPVVNKTPKLNSIKVTYDDLTIEGRLKDLERINSINIAKLNFKSNAILKSEKYEMHDMIIDTCDTDEMVVVSAAGSSEKTEVNLPFTEPVSLGEGKVSEFSLSPFKSIKKVEVK